MLNANMTLGALAALTLCFAKAAPDAPRFVCKEGVTVKRTLDMKCTRELTKFTIHADDTDTDHDEIHRTSEAGWKMVVSDEVRSCSDGSVTGLARTYNSLVKTRTETVKTPEGEKATDMPETSELADKTVVFKRGEDKKTWKRTIDDEAADELTADLAPDMDYRVLLPGTDAGAKWEVDMADAKTALLRPGGDIPFHGKEEPKSMDKRLRKLAWESLQGKLSLELGNAREEAGHKVIDITFKGDMSSDATTAPEGDEKGPTSVRIEDAQKLGGKLVWNLDAGRAQSIEWSSKGTLKLTVAGKGKRPDGTEIDAQQIQAFDEEYAYTGAFEAH